MAGFPKAGDEYGGRYRIVRQIGHGGMGSVYEAVDKVLNRPVAVKIVLPSLGDREDFQARFAREAAVLAKIRSRHIVVIHEYGEDEDTVFFVTELFPDGDLQTWLSRNGPLERRQALTLIAQVCEALSDAHAADVIHRDVKPGNVLLWKRAEGLIPYLADFGIATDGQKGVTRTGTLVGSPAYMAPERHFGHAADERGDVYSTGCLLWAALTGNAPYSGTDFQVMSSHINEPTPQLGTGHPLDDQIDAVLADALQKDPERRIATAAELQQRLMAVVAAMAGQDLSTPPPPPVVAPVPPADDPGTAIKPSLARLEAADEEPDPVDEQPSSLSSGSHTTIRPALAPPVAAGPAGAELAGAAPRRRRGVWLVAALLVALVLGGTAWAIAAAGGDEEEPAPPSADPSPTATSPTESTAPPPTAPDAPDAPKVRAAAAYRAVTFAVAAPGGAVAEYRDGDTWAEADDVVTLRTEQGGDRACLVARSVASSDGQDATSDPVRTCGRAEARTVEFIRKAGDPCTNSQGGACTWYDVRVSGFAGPATPLVTVRRPDGAGFCAPYQCEWDRITIGKDGRGYLRHDWKISDDEGEVILVVDGVSGRFRVFH